MSFIKNLFGNNKSERTPVQIIEDELKILLPKKFKQLLLEKLPKGDSIKIELLDGSYKFLDSLFRTDVTDRFEHVVNLSKDLNASYYPEEKEFVKIPFAKSTEGDGYKYLYFIAEKEKEASEKIFLRDMDYPKGGRILLSEHLSFVFNKVEKINDQTVVSNTTLNFSEVNNWLEIPECIRIWKDSYTVDIREELKDDNFFIDFDILNYLLENGKGDFSKIDVQVIINYQNKRISSGFSFMMGNPNLQGSFRHNGNYSIFYHKLAFIVKTLDTLATDLKENHDIEIVEFLNTLDLGKIAKKGVNEINEMSV